MEIIILLKKESKLKSNDMQYLRKQYIIPHARRQKNPNFDILFSI